MFIGPTLPTVMSSMYQINSCTLQKLGKTRHKQNPLFEGIKGNRGSQDWKGHRITSREFASNIGKAIKPIRCPIIPVTTLGSWSSVAQSCWETLSDCVESA